MTLKFSVSGEEERGASAVPYRYSEAGFLSSFRFNSLLHILSVPLALLLSLSLSFLSLASAYLP
ncbi:hypothetical protein L873DRAFT_1811290 [Choiromyces venosus 120613-1]|uniref:Transmembrane protein n=1 Tax=Choiromyces venosus 120613-1 TaxID=1336337 RepID=A0A3N4JHG7_9PEZI|nr:hypothetical protein L873DRAFT_1811290 [Choiromyces venosus 120613-1]